MKELKFLADVKFALIQIQTQSELFQAKKVSIYYCESNSKS